MYKIYLTILPLFFIIAVSAQVGINEETPKATLDVKGEPATTTTMDGIIPPRITADQLSAKTYSGDQTGAMVYVINPPSASFVVGNTQTTYVNNPGYYFFDGIQWSQMIESNKKGGKCVKSSGTIDFPSNSDNGTQITVGDYDFRWYWNNGNAGSENSHLEIKKKNSSIQDAAVISKNIGGSGMEQAQFKDITSATDWTQVTNGNFRDADQAGEVLLMSNKEQAFRITAGGTVRGTRNFSEFCYYVEELN